ncbi:MAG TPA: chemotaxis protein CheW [Trichocoleus sp.]|jgi:twitching motility protein PilI
MNTSALALQGNRPQRNLGDAYLKFQLSPHLSAVMSMQHIQEVLLLSTQRVTPMPSMPACVLGLTHRRSRVLWIVDLAQLLGVAHRQTYVQQNSLIIVQIGTVLLGFVVHQVESMAWFPPEAIQSPIGQVSASIVPYLRGYILQTHQQQQEAVLVLDTEAIAQSSILCG